MSGRDAAAASRPRLPTLKDRKLAVCAARAAGATATDAAREAGITRSRLLQWRREDAAFAAGWDDAEEAYRDALRAEAWRRAVTGWSEPLIAAGKPVLGPDGERLSVRRCSDTVLLHLMRWLLPEAGARADAPSLATLAGLSDDQLRTLAAVDREFAAGDGADLGGGGA